MILSLVPPYLFLFSGGIYKDKHAKRKNLRTSGMGRLFITLDNIMPVIGVPTVEVRPWVLIYSLVGGHSLLECIIREISSRMAASELLHPLVA